MLPSSRQRDARGAIIAALLTVLGTALLPAGSYVAYALVWLAVIAAGWFAWRKRGWRPRWNRLPHPARGVQAWRDREPDRLEVDGPRRDPGLREERGGAAEQRTRARGHEVAPQSVERERHPLRRQDVKVSRLRHAVRRKREDHSTKKCGR